MVTFVFSSITSNVKVQGFGSTKNENYVSLSKPAKPLLILETQISLIFVMQSGSFRILDRQKGYHVQDPET